MLMPCRLQKVTKMRNQLRKNEVESWEGEMYLKKVVIPQLKGCTIQHVNNDEVQAWTVKYPGATPYGIRTRSYTDAEPSEASARHCVEWV